MAKEEEIVAAIVAGQAKVTSEVDSEFLEDFIVETREHLETIENDLLALETDPGNMETVHSLFRSFHTVKGMAGFVEQDLIGRIAHQTETLLDQCRKGHLIVSKILVNLILASCDHIKRICGMPGMVRDRAFVAICQAHIQALNTGAQPAGNNAPALDSQQPPRLGELMVASGAINEQQLHEGLEKQALHPEMRLGQVLVREGKAEVRDVIQSLRSQEEVSPVPRSSSVHDGAYMRIPTAKVDNLVDLLGELLITQSLIEQETMRRFGQGDSLNGKLMRMSRITRDIQNISMSLRMVALKSTFQKIARIGRDTADELGKGVLLQFSGEETEIDRSVAEKILDPLLHLVKNSIAHGIEERDERQRQGKPPQGQIRVQAYSRRGTVFIEVADDGGGINLAKVRDKAIKRGLIDGSKAYGDDEIVNCIFKPGFSTADTVTNVAGRGVGLDVVKTEISKIGGKVEVISQLGKGSTFVLKIPINMAIINGTIIELFGSRYIVPTLNLKRIFKPEDDQWVTVRGKTSAVRLRDEIISLIPIARILGCPAAQPEELVLILELEQQVRALPAQGIIGKQEIVVKPLGHDFRSLPYASGATILGDGNVALIMDVEHLFRREGED